MRGGPMTSHDLAPHLTMWDDRLRAPETRPGFVPPADPRSTREHGTAASTSPHRGLEPTGPVAETAPLRRMTAPSSVE